MEFLLSISISILAGLMLSRVAKILKLPAVTAYLVAGILVGPYVLGAFGVDGLGFTSHEKIDIGRENTLEFSSQNQILFKTLSI